MKQNSLRFWNRNKLARGTIEKLMKFCSSKSKLSIYLNFSWMVIFSLEFYTTISPFGTDISFTIYSGSYFLGVVICNSLEFVQA